jgi:hypothetical protein
MPYPSQSNTPDETQFPQGAIEQGWKIEQSNAAKAVAMRDKETLRTRIRQSKCGQPDRRQ